MKSRLKTLILSVAAVMALQSFSSTAGAAEKAALPKQEVKKQVQQTTGTGASLGKRTDLDMTVAELWQQIEKVVSPYIGEYSLLSIEHSLDGKAGKVEAKHIGTGKQVAFTIQSPALKDVSQAKKAEITWTKSDGFNITFKKTDGSTSLIHCLLAATPATSTPTPTKKTAMTKLVPAPLKGS